MSSPRSRSSMVMKDVLDTFIAYQTLVSGHAHALSWQLPHLRLQRSTEIELAKDHTPSSHQHVVQRPWSCHCSQRIVRSWANGNGDGHTRTSIRAHGRSRGSHEGRTGHQQRQADSILELTRKWTKSRDFLTLATCPYYMDVMLQHQVVLIVSCS